MLRMIQTGYVQPTDYTGFSEEDSLWKRLAAGGARKFRELENAVTQFFSASLRPTVLSWPGALELGPASSVALPSICVAGGAFFGPVEEAPVVRSHFDPQFWREQPGASFLSGVDPAQVPATFDAVLAKAREFRNDYFRVTRAEVPAYLYFSGFWVTPGKAALATDGRFSTRPWYAIEGDGRVPSQATYATLPGQPPTTFAGTIGVKSVHGDLPLDEDFQSEFFGERLPRLVNANAAVEMMNAMVADKALLRAYIAAKGEPVIVDELAHALGSTRATTEQIAVVRDAVAVAERFRAAYCMETTCADYRRANAARDKAPSLRVAKNYGTSLAGVDPHSPRAVLAQGNKGLQLAKAGNWESAAVALAESEAEFDLLPDNYDRRPRVIPDFKAKVRANLGRALAQVGRCEDAKRFLETAKDTNKYASQSWNQVCMEKASGNPVGFVEAKQ